MAESDTILQLGIEAAREGNRDEARNLFSLLTRQEPDNLQAWLWLAGVAEGPEQRRQALERVLELDPNNEMAVKGLQAMGVSPTVRLAETPAPSTAVSRAMSDEERYAAELDSAFDDYESVPRASSRTEPIISDSSVGMIGEQPEMSSRDKARERAATRRAVRESKRTSLDDDELLLRPARSRPSWLLFGAGALILAVLLLFVVYQFFSNNQTPGDATNTASGLTVTQTVIAMGQGRETPTIDLTMPTMASGAITGTETLTDTQPLTNTQPLTGPTTAPLPPVSVANASPALVPVGTMLEANGWSYVYPNATYAVILGPQQGSFTTQGTYVLVLVHVANNTGTRQPVPADFFVLKDAQGRVYEARPQVSSAYVQRGINADVGMEDAIEANGIITSVPLIFDVQHGATNLVLFTRPKPDQGWQVLESVP